MKWSWLGKWKVEEVLRRDPDRTLGIALEGTLRDGQILEIKLLDENYILTVCELRGKEDEDLVAVELFRNSSFDEAWNYAKVWIEF